LKIVSTRSPTVSISSCCQPIGAGSSPAAPNHWSIGTELEPEELREDFIKSLQRHAEVDEPETLPPVEELASEDMLHRQLTEEELLRALTSEAQRRAEPQPEDTGDYEE
jgi:hypothetical protein